MKLFARAIIRSLSVLASVPLAVSADTVKLKDGSTYEGILESESTDKIEFNVRVSKSIQESKTISKQDIQELKITSTQTETGKLRQSDQKNYKSLKIGGMNYRNVTVIEAWPSGLKIVHENGSGFFDFDLLTEQVKADFQYDPEKADKHRKSVASAKAIAEAELMKKSQENAKVEKERQDKIKSEEREKRELEIERKDYEEEQMGKAREASRARKEKLDALAEKAENQRAIRDAGNKEIQALESEVNALRASIRGLRITDSNRQSINAVEAAIWSKMKIISAKRKLLNLNAKMALED